jgi:hypothetical protein
MGASSADLNVVLLVCVFALITFGFVHLTAAVLGRHARPGTAHWKIYLATFAVASGFIDITWKEEPYGWLYVASCVAVSWGWRRKANARLIPPLTAGRDEALGKHSS